MPLSPSSLLPLAAAAAPAPATGAAPVDLEAAASPSPAASATTASVISASAPSATATADRHQRINSNRAEYDSANARVQTFRDRARSPTTSELELRKSRDLADGPVGPRAQLAAMRRNTVADGLSPGGISVAIPHEAQDERAAGVSPTKKHHGSQDLVQNNRRSFRQQSTREVVFGTPVKEGHVNYMLMYDMLTGIRISVSRCNAKPLRDLVPEDFVAAHKLAFDVTGNEMTPSSKYDFKFKDYAPWVFRRIRECFHVDPAEYLLSLTGKYVLSELPTAGKSGSFFYYSRDYRFIIKTIHHSEHKFILRTLRQYYEHIRSNPHTLLSRIFGLHRVKLPGNKKIHFVVMGNVFPPNKDIHETYDLKGSIVGRSIPEEKARSNPRAVMKDLNWLERNRKLLLGPEKRKLLIEQMERDTAFLRSQGIMDYSLLVGMHDAVRGNRENVRETNLAVFEPNSQTLSRRATAATRISKAKAIKQANVESDVVPLDPSNSMLPDNAPPERRYCIFYQDEGGFRATDEANFPLQEIYFIGIIDIFTRYGAAKKIENFAKSLGNDRTKISAVNPKLYASRFMDFMKNSIRGFVGDPATAGQIPPTPISATPQGAGLPDPSSPSTWSPSPAAQPI
ncbi:Phosphatidylinositol-4-phosphate 5-kinase [Polyrhizophydium stewartii]|uniref:Phosphatidylinositol-4-phosphate 5-kinase n=1 Tax=Polyrhizophydium stewartii TaxID=2732419 RepID=A0ABR4NK70_9FUNG